MRCGPFPAGMALIGMLLAPAAAFGQGDPVVRITPGGGALKIAVQRFAPDAASAQLVSSFRDESSQALEFSSYFKPVPDAAFLEPLNTLNLEAPMIPCDNWRAIGSDVLLEGRIERVEKRQRVRYRVWDVSRCRQQGRPAAITVDPDQLWLAARQVADDVVERFTRRRGVAATQIAFVSDQTGNKEIYVMESDGTRSRRVTQNGHVNLFPAWSRDGRVLLYTSYRSGAPDLWMLFRGKRGRRFTNGDGDSADQGERYRGIFGPQDGQITYVMNRDGNTDLFLGLLDGSSYRQLTTNRAIEVSPTWSPDGALLAFVSDRGGSPQIYLKDTRTGVIRRLTFRGSYNTSPAWSPTGEWIAYSARVQGGNHDLYLVDPDSGYTAPLTAHPRTEEDPSWSPDGRKIAFSSNRRGRRDIFVVDVDGRNTRRITQGMGNCTNPAWSNWSD